MPPPRRPATILSTSAIGSISGTAPRGRRSETRLQLPHDRLALPGGQELRQVVRERRQPGGDLALALLGLEQLVRDVERGQDRRFVRLHDGTLRQHFLEGLVHVGRHVPGVLRWQIGPHRVLVAPDHHFDRVLLGAHGGAPAPEAPAVRPPPLGPESRACSSRNVSRDRRSCTRRRAASTRCRSVLFSCSRSVRRPRASRSGLTLPAPPRAPLSFNSASALRARVRQPVSSSATCRRIVSSWSSTGPSALSPSYAKLVLQSREPPGQRRLHFRLAQRARRVAERAVPRDAALTGWIPGPRYSSNTSRRSSNGPTARRSTSATCAALTPTGSTRATSRSTGGCTASGRYTTGARSVSAKRSSSPNNGAAQTGASASRGPACPTTSPPRCTATHPTASPVAASTLQPGAASSTANSKWYFKSHMSISGSFAPSDQCGGRRAPVRTAATEVHSSGAPVPCRKTVPTSNSRTSRLRLAQLCSTRRTSPGSRRRRRCASSADRGLRIRTASGPSGGPSGSVRASSRPRRTKPSRTRVRACSSGASGTVPGR